MSWVGVGRGWVDVINCLLMVVIAGSLLCSNNTSHNTHSLLKASSRVFLGYLFFIECRGCVGGSIGIEMSK